MEYAGYVQRNQPTDWSKVTGQVAEQLAQVEQRREAKREKLDTAFKETTAMMGDIEMGESPEFNEVILDTTDRGRAKIYDAYKKMRAGVAWHTDESIFENLRINIPVETHPIFVLEQKGYPPQHLQANYAYSWNTSLLHRAYCTERTESPLYRTHIMLGFSCWWDFNETTETWTQNEFFGKKHPWDMLNDGEVIPGLKLV